MYKRTQQRGIALVLVLWMLALLTVLATGYSSMMRTEAQLTANLVRAAQAKALAEAGVWRTLAELLRPVQEQSWKADGSNYSLEFANGTVEIRIQDEAGKIDLNTARAELLMGLLQAVDVEEENRSRLLNAILDWRDRDSQAREDGAEDDDYQRMNLNYGAKDGPFNTVDELQLVLGITPELYKKMKPSLTVHSHQRGVHLQVAPREVLMAIPAVSEERVEEFLAIRTTNADSTSSLTLTGIDLRYASRVKGQTFTITSVARLADTVARLDAVVRIKGGSNLPYSILSWREGQSAGSEIPAAFPGSYDG